MREEDGWRVSVSHTSREWQSWERAARVLHRSASQGEREGRVVVVGWRRRREREGRGWRVSNFIYRNE